MLHMSDEPRISINTWANYADMLSRDTSLLCRRLLRLITQDEHSDEFLKEYRAITFRLYGLTINLESLAEGLQKKNKPSVGESDE